MAHIRPLVCDDDAEEDNDEDYYDDDQLRATAPTGTAGETDEKTEMVSASTRHELEWFKLAGLDSLVSNLLDRQQRGSNQRTGALDHIKTHFSHWMGREKALWWLFRLNCVQWR